MKTEYTDQKAFNAITKARTTLIIEQPFFGTLAMRLKMIEDKSIKTLDINGVVMRYNPAFVNKLDSNLTKSAVAHEVIHCVMEHVGPQARGKGLDPRKWNYAADYADNDVLKKAGFTLGDGWLWDAQYSGMTAEHIYNIMPPLPPDDGSGGTGGPQDNISPGNPDPAMAAQQAAEWKVATVQAANAAKAVGKLHESLEKFVDKLLENKVDWAAELRQFITQVAKGDYAWNRPDKKMMAAGFILPGLYSEEMGAVAIYSDESGSVDDAVLRAFGAEVAAIQQDLRPSDIMLGHFDTHVGKVEHFGPDDPFEMKRYAGGGTDFRPVIKHAQRMQPPPMCAIILTDLEGPFPASPPDFPVLWVSINDKVAPFGDTLHIEV